MHDRDARFKSIRLSRNFGHQVALTAGLDQARGNAVIAMDADFRILRRLRSSSPSAGGRATRSSTPSASSVSARRG